MSVREVFPGIKDRVSNIRFYFIASSNCRSANHVEHQDPIVCSSRPLIVDVSRVV